MWVQRSPKEIAAAQRKEFSGYLWPGLILGVIAGLFAAFRYNRWTGSFAAGPIGMTRVVLNILGFGLPFGLLYAYFQFRAEKAWICPACERTKRPDSAQSCPCGGTYQDLLSVKWAPEKRADAVQPR